MKMKKLPPEAKRGRATDHVKEGYGNRSAAEIDCPQDSPKGERSESKPRADGQEPNRAGAKRRQPASGAMQATPTRRVEVAQHTEDDWYACGGKFGGSAVEQRAITWGDLTVARR